MIENLASYQKKPTNIFSSFDIAKIEKQLQSKDEIFWQNLGKKKSWHLFKQMAARVPAYKDFLKKNNIKADSVKKADDLIKLPVTDKKNYIQAYALNERCWDGKVTEASIIAASSGTTGDANYWPRGDTQELRAVLIHELIYRNFFKIDKYKTLCLIGFPMGVYVSGIATLLPTWLISQKNYNLTVVSVGNNKDEFLRLIKTLASGFEQIIMVGHPFFIKDVLETGKSQGLKWSSLWLRMMFCSEGFNEKWRSYLNSVIGKKSDLTSIISTYGSSEFLLMAQETPMAILYKQYLEGRLSANDQKFPSYIFQYNPALNYIEEVNNEFIFTADSGLPLIRFNLHDQGKLLSYRRVSDILDANVTAWSRQAKVAPIWQLPFLNLWGRSDQTVIFYAANIYPEHIKAGLHSSPLLAKLTGKFNMRKAYLKNMDEFLEINIELRRGVKGNSSLAKKIQSNIINQLRRTNFEYLFLCDHLDKDLTPRIKLWPCQHEKYFKPGLKPRYII